jgi:hypothetical protein
MTFLQKLLGFVLVALGVALMAASLADLIIRVIVAMFGYWIINYGLRVAGQPSLSFLLARWFAFRRFF